MTGLISHQLIEITISPQKEEFAFLNEQKYKINIINAPREKISEVVKFTIKPISICGKAVLYLKKLNKIIKAGNINFKAISRVLASNKSEQCFGINLKNEDDNGPILQRELELSRITKCVFEYDEETVSIIQKLAISEDCQNIDARDQLNELHINLEIEPSNNIQYKFFCPEHDRITNDSFWQIAKAVLKFPTADVIVFDKFQNGFICEFKSLDYILLSQISDQICFLQCTKQAENFLKGSNLEDLYTGICVKSSNIPICHGQITRTTPIFTNYKKKHLISIIIPTKDHIELLSAAINSIKNTTKLAYEIIVLNNRSKEAKSLEYFKEIAKAGVKIVNADFEFNFSKLCNLGTTYAVGDVLLFMNNDVEILSKDWLECIYSMIENEKIGAIGAKLYFQDMTLQHAGVFLGISDGCGHLFHNLSSDKNCNYPLLMYPSCRDAVTGAFLAISADNFKNFGPFNENDFPITYNDVDLCLELIKNSKLVIFNPLIEAIHKETQSRPNDKLASQRIRRQSENNKFWAKWKENIISKTNTPTYIKVNSSKLYSK